MMDFNLGKDYLGLSDVIFVNDEHKESKIYDMIMDVPDMMEQTMEVQGDECTQVTAWKLDDTPKAKCVLPSIPNTAGEKQVCLFPRHEVETQSIFAHTQQKLAKNPGEQYETRNLFQQRPFSQKELYGTPNSLQQRSPNPLQEATQRERTTVQNLPFLPKYGAQHVFQHRRFSQREHCGQRPPSSPVREETRPERSTVQYMLSRPLEQDLASKEFQQRPISRFLERYQSPTVLKQASNPSGRSDNTRVSAIGCTHCLEPYICDISHVGPTSSKEQCQVGRTGQDLWSGMPSVKQKPDASHAEHDTVIQHSEKHVSRFGTRQQKRQHRGARPDRLLRHNQSETFERKDVLGFKQFSEASFRYPLPPIPVDVTHSQDQTSLPIQPSELAQSRTCKNNTIGIKKNVPANAASKDKLVCKFCKTNGETKVFYMSHDLKDAKGLVTCPVLRTFRCPICKATGDHAHTVTYCPFGSGKCSVMVTSRTPRMSCGRPRLFDLR